MEKELRGIIQKEEALEFEEKTKALKKQRVLSILPPFDWYLNIRYDPWNVPPIHRYIALMEHTFIYGLLGFVMSFLVGLEKAILVFILSALIGTPIEIYLARRGTKIWNFVKGREKREINMLFLGAVINTFIYYAIGACIAHLEVFLL